MGMGRDGTPGSAGLHLAAGVPLLHPDEQVFAAMLEGGGCSSWPGPVRWFRAQCRLVQRVRQVAVW